MRWSCTRCFSTTRLRPLANLQPTNTIDNHQETILLFRALLRQCTYLPDSAARKYLRLHIAERFHAYQPIARGKDRRPIRKKETKKDPLKALKYARKCVKYLQRANDGHIPHLQTVLNMTYGRLGKRSRQLMANLQALDPLAEDTSIAPSSTGVPKHLSDRRKKVPKLSDEVQALLKSQARQDSSRFHDAPLKALQPNVPAVNSWGRPFPQNRKANFIRKWYKTTMERLMPPLPDPEWERLRGLASGEIPWDGPLRRRKLGTTVAANESNYRALDQLALPNNIPHRLTSSTARVVEKGRHEETRTNPHELTPRFMRSMWSRVFWKCPRLDWSDEHQKWLVAWGRMGKQAGLVFDSHIAIPDGMFDGVDEIGTVISKKSAPSHGTREAEEQSQSNII